MSGPSSTPASAPGPAHLLPARLPRLPRRRLQDARRGRHRSTSSSGPGTGPLYDLQGRTWSGERYLAVFREARDIVRGEHPSFDLKLIICGSRYEPVWQVWKNLLAMLPLRLAHPEFVVGYDLVGEEDGGNKTAYYFEVLSLSPSSSTT